MREPIGEALLNRLRPSLKPKGTIAETAVTSFDLSRRTMELLRSAQKSRRA